jgi:SAM-dependent methyltransferase
MNERTFRVENSLILENPDRLIWLPPGEVISALGLRAGMTVVDIGAGTGYFSIPVAQAVGERGRVVAVDLQQGMLDILGGKIKKLPGRENIDLVRGEATATTVPAGSGDIILMANIWHELDDHPAVLAEMKRILAPGGVLAILDWRPDREPPPGPPTGHRVPAGDVGSDLSVNGWKPSGVIHIGRYHYLILSGLGQ